MQLRSGCCARAPSLFLRRSSSTLPALGSDVLAVLETTSPSTVLRHLAASRYACVRDTYPAATKMYSLLKRTLRREIPSTDFHSERKYQEKAANLLSRFLLPIQDSRIALSRAPADEVPKWLANGEYVSLRQYLGYRGKAACLRLQLVAGWREWNSKGVKLPFLSHTLHPHYGVYFPMRTEHLTLFDAWLASHMREFGNIATTALDVGVGSGVLSFMMLRAGVSRVVGTDTNPAAVRSVHEDAARAGYDKARLSAVVADLFPPFKDKFDVVVFNPPWVPLEADGASSGAMSSPLLNAVYTTDDALMTRFFAAAASHLSERGRIVVLYSNLARIAGLTKDHPVEAELRLGRLRLHRKADKAAAPPSGNAHPWLSALRKRERLELWEMKLG